MIQAIIWFALALIFGVVYTLFRARWWLYLSVIFLDNTLLAALGLDNTTQLISLGLLIVGFVVLDLLIFKRKKPVSSG
ncbi:MAG: hypothetical protein ABIM74_10690 [candidate division WOR-3 bacterium]